MRVHDELTAAKNTRARGHEGHPKLHQDVQEVEDVGDSPEIGDQDGGAVVVAHASGAVFNVGEVEIEGVDEEGE